MHKQFTSWLADLDIAGLASAYEKATPTHFFTIDDFLPPDFAPGRDHLVEDLEASALLLQHIDGRDDDDPSLGEAFYLLGLVEARNVEGYWLPMTEAHLEAAVRVDPRGPFAKPAYVPLDEYWVVENGGAGERDLIRPGQREVD